MDFNGATAVVTGGGSGVGAATASQVAACGAKINSTDEFNRRLG